MQTENYVPQSLKKTYLTFFVRPGDTGGVRHTHMHMHVHTNKNTHRHTQTQFDWSPFSPVFSSCILYFFVLSVLWPLSCIYHTIHLSYSQPVPVLGLSAGWAQRLSGIKLNLCTVEWECLANVHTADLHARSELLLASHVLGSMFVSLFSDVNWQQCQKHNIPKMPYMYFYLYISFMFWSIFLFIQV